MSAINWPKVWEEVAAWRAHTEGIRMPARSYLTRKIEEIVAANTTVDTETDRLRAQRDSLLTTLREATLDLDDSARLIEDEIGGDFGGTAEEMRNTASNARKVIAEVEAAP